MSFMILGQEEFDKKIQRLPINLLTDLCPAVIMQSNVPYGEQQPPMPIVIHKSYDTIADWSVHPQNKALIWLLTNIPFIVGLLGCIKKDETVLISI